MSNEWRDFESLAFDIQKQLSPEAIVKKNERITGKSGHKREIDISVRQRVGQFDLLIIIDCKQYKRPVDIKVIESFIGQIGDVCAHQGAIVSSSGYTKSAIKRAKNAGVNLYHLGNTLASDIASNIGFPALCFVRDFREITSRVIFTCSERLKISSPLVFYSGKNQELGSERDVIKKWLFESEEAYSLTSGEYKNLIIMKDKLFIMNGESLLSVEMKLDFLIEDLTFYRVVPVDFVGYKNVINGQFEMQQFTPESLSIERLKKDWVLVDTSDLAVRAVMRYGIRCLNAFGPDSPE